jgi:hypothetical protein
MGTLCRVTVGASVFLLAARNAARDAVQLSGPKRLKPEKVRFRLLEPGHQTMQVADS